MTSVSAPGASGSTQRVPADLERWGMYEFVEPQVRHLVADHLGVGIEKLVADVSLREDLAADSLDLVALAVALEDEFAIVVTERLLEHVQTYGDLIHSTGLLIRERVEAEARGAEPSPRIWMRIVAETGESVGTLDRTDRLTPYVAETIAEDARRTGTRKHVEVTVASSTRAGLARVRQQLARVCGRGVEVIVRRGHRPGMPVVVPGP